MSQLLDKSSLPSANSLIDLFSVPPTQTVIDSSYWYAAHPVNTLSSDGPFQFTVSAGPEYLQLGKNYLSMKLKITKHDGTNLDENDFVAPINIIAKTFFKQVKVDINGKLAYDSGPMYAYRAYLETILNYNWDCLNTFLGAAMYEKDKPADKVETEDNVGFITLQKDFHKSKVVEVMAPIHCDLFLADRLMLSNTQLHLELHRNHDQFGLMCFKENCPDYKIEVLDMVWYVKKMVISPTVHMGVESALMRRPAKYPLRRIAMTKLHIGPGRQSTPTTSVFDGQIPRRIILGFVHTDNYFGRYNKNPFLFFNNNVKEISVHAGGHMFPREPLKTDFHKNFYSRAYLQLFDTLGFPDENKSNNIMMDDFKLNTCLFAFDLTPDESDSNHWELIKEGTTTVHCTFAAPIKDPGLEMIVYAEFDNLAMIDRNRTLYFDYSV